jgi:cell division protein FtsI/penicillin-binding protein 2
MSPLDVATLTSAIAVGTYRSPLLLPLPNSQREFALAEIGVTPAGLELIRKGFEDAVSTASGTARMAGADGRLVAGLTGTAQTSVRGEKSRNA